MANLTLLDIARKNGNDAVVGLIEENKNAVPEVANFPMRTIRGTSYKTLIRSAVPTVGFRQANEGTAGLKSTYVNKLVETFLQSGIIKVDVAVASASEDGPDAVKADEASGVARGAMLTIGTQTYYGSNSTFTGDADGFPGFIDLVDANFIVDATGAAGGTGSSVYGIRFGPQGVSYVGGNGTGMTLGDWREELVLDSGGTNEYNAWVASLDSWIGLQVVDISALGRIADLTAENNKTLDDDLLADLMEKAPVGGMWEAFYMNRRSLGQLRKSRTATTEDGRPAPFPTSAHGIPIVVTDSIVSTETLDYNLT